MMCKDENEVGLLKLWKKCKILHIDSNARTAPELQQSILACIAATSHLK